MRKPLEKRIQSRNHTTHASHFSKLLYRNDGQANGLVGPRQRRNLYPARYQNCLRRRILR